MGNAENSLNAATASIAASLKARETADSSLSSAVAQLSTDLTSHVTAQTAINADIQKKLAELDDDVDVLAEVVSGGTIAENKKLLEQHNANITTLFQQLEFNAGDEVLSITVNNRERERERERERQREKKKNMLMKAAGT